MNRRSRKTPPMPDESVRTLCQTQSECCNAITEACDATATAVREQVESEVMDWLQRRWASGGAHIGTEGLAVLEGIRSGAYRKTSEAAPATHTNTQPQEPGTARLGDSKVAGDSATGSTSSSGAAEDLAAAPAAPPSEPMLEAIANAMLADAAEYRARAGESHCDEPTYTEGYCRGAAMHLTRWSHMVRTWPLAGAAPSELTRAPVVPTFDECRHGTEGARTDWRTCSACCAEYLARDPAGAYRKPTAEPTDAERRDDMGKLEGPPWPSPVELRRQIDEAERPRQSECAHRWQRTGRDGLYRCRDCNEEQANMDGCAPPADQRLANIDVTWHNVTVLVREAVHNEFTRRDAIANHRDSVPQQAQSESAALTDGWSEAAEALWRDCMSEVSTMPNVEAYGIRHHIREAFRRRALLREPAAEEVSLTDPPPGYTVKDFGENYFVAYDERGSPIAGGTRESVVAHAHTWRSRKGRP